MQSKFMDRMLFLYNQRIKGFAIPDLPQFDEEGLAYFMERLRKSKCYLEYGSGGSTVQAARLRKEFVSVEGDRFYFRAVRKKIHGDCDLISGKLIHANIGITGRWGYPFLKTQSAARLRRWRDYAEKPWGFVKSIPDLILIDGRFRVHCALYSISKIGSNDVEILVDDYAGREHYREIEKFAELTQMHGRMAAFRSKPCDAPALNLAISRFASDYR